MKKLLMTIAMTTLPFAAFSGAYEQLFENGVLRFNYTPAELTALEAQAEQELLADLQKIAAIEPLERNFDNTVLALENAYTRYWFVPKTLSLLSYFHKDAAVREAAAALESKGSATKADILSRRDLYKAFKAYTDHSFFLPEQEQRLVNKWTERFERAGMALPDRKLAKFNALNTRRLEKITQYNVNLNNYYDELAVSREQLEGLSENYINRLEQTPEGKYRVSLKYPDYNPFMANAVDEPARRELHLKYAKRGGKENVKLLEDTLRLRSKQAKLLGYDKHPDFVLPVRMAKNTQTLELFLKDIEKQIKPLADAERQTYLQFKRDTTGDMDAQLPIWDAPYWANEYKKKLYAVDDEKIKEYFPMEKVLDGMMNLFADLMGLRFEPVDLPTWQEDVLTFALKDKQTGKLISYIYLDLYPRNGKYTHAATWSFVDRFKRKDGSYQTPFVVIAANFNPPGNAIPSLLNHSEVLTLFHEFGHVLQMSLATADYAALTGDNLAWDYIETHSQLLENWAWSPQVLKSISAHYQTREPLPDEMIAAMIRAKNVGVPSAFIRQNFLGQLDLAYHTSNRRVNTTKVYADLSKEITGVEIEKGTYPQASFAHIMSITDPYDVGYYVYAWSLVIAQDIFSQFEEQGLFNKALGARLREYIYTPGTASDENEMVEKFLGRPYNNEAFFKSLGVPFPAPAVQ